MIFNPFSSITAKIYGGIAIAAITFATIQTVRIEGLWFIKGYQERLEQAKERNDKLIAANELATANAKAEKARIDAENERKAQDAAEYEKKLRSDYDKRLANWLRSQNRGSSIKANLSSPAQAPKGTDGEVGFTGIPEGYALVSIPELQKVPRCYAMVEAWQEWARSVQISSGVAE